MVGFELLLISAFFSALSSLLFALATKRLKYAEFAEVFLYVSLSLCFAGMLLLLHYLITDNFSIYYVYAYSQREMGFEYKIAALWAGKEGSLLLWAFASLLVTSIFTNYGVKDLRKAKALTVLTAINSFLLILILLSNPFEVLPFKYNNGIGMNPLLRTPEMIIHPPLVFFGYSLVACIYAGHLAEIENRGLVKLAWAFLTAGIVLGGFWAYRTLGWGGFWGWDPVENASLLPWLSLTAYLHARKGKEFFAYLSMVFVAFTAFVTRSGILSSVHSFGEDPTGWIYLFLILACSLPLIRKWEIEDRCYTSLIFGAMIVVVLLGTVANLFRSVDRSYYLITFTPIFFATAILTLYRLRSSTKKLIHLGVILLFIGATSVWFFESKETIILSPNGEVDGIEFYLQDVSSHWNPEKTVVKAKILSSIGSIEPEIHVYPQSTVSKAFILNTPLMDYYFAMKSAGSNFVEIEFYRVPLIALVWLGSSLLLLGLISQKFRIRL
ncbi:MAG: cytochrome c-type biosis protein CcmF [Archaeoglobaceae archaeon]|nr:cytochrome c-type biosis protein CcmF [Archaeoglobaceae archaeon]